MLIVLMIPNNQLIYLLKNIFSKKINVHRQYYKINISCERFFDSQPF